MLNATSKRTWKHWIQAANGGKGLMATCPNTGLTGICPIEKRLATYAKDDPRINEERAKKRFIVNVLDRTPYTVCPSCNVETPGVSNENAPGKFCISCGSVLKNAEYFPLNKVKLLEGGPRLFAESLNFVDKMQRDELNVEITDYDITFITIGEARERRINAIPQNPEPLTEEAMVDRETGEPQKLFDLDILAEPSTVEEIEAMLKGATINELNILKGIE